MANQGETAVLFGDIRDFTSYTAAVGDQRAYAQARSFTDIVAEASLRHGGRVVKTYGDGAMVEIPDGSEAVRCAVQLLRCLGDYNAAHPDAPIAAGVGIAWGQPIHDGDDLFGHSVNLAKRLADHARGGQIVVCPQIRARNDEPASLRFLPLGELRLKGLAPQPAFEVVWRDEIARLVGGHRSDALVLILTADKLVVELSKTLQQKIDRAQDSVRQRAKERGLAGFIVRRLERRLPRWVDRALEQAGIGFEHPLHKVRLFWEGNELVLRPEGRRGMRLDADDFEPEAAQAFVQRFQSMQQAHGRGSMRGR